MLGDVAVAVHPHNERLKRLIGKTAVVPLADRPVPIVADEYADPEKGSGAVKITPAHDFNDFDVWQRHKNGAMWRYPPINILTKSGELLLDPNIDFKRSDPTPETLRTIELYNGIDRFVARKKIVERLEELGLIEKIEPTLHVVPHGDRSGAVLEPFLTDQWYVDAKALAQPAIGAVRKGKTVFVPAQWEATFFNWMENIQPWCISRQIWWGHQIPCWYGFKRGEDGLLLIASSNREKRITEGFVAETEADALAQARSYYGGNVQIVTSERDALDFTGQQTGSAHYAIWRDEDVLDTWFSSALWPFSTLGWPDQTPELKRFYPTTVLVTGFDIIFFWVARMMMMGLHFMQKERPGAPLESVVPFHDVYIHALGARRQRRENVEVEGQRHRSAGNCRRVWRRRFTLYARRHGGPGTRHQALARNASKVIAISQPNFGMPRALPRSTAACQGRDFDPRLAKEFAQSAGLFTRAAETLGKLKRRWRTTNFNDAASDHLSLCVESSIATGIWNWRSPCSSGSDGAAKNRNAGHGRLGSRRHS